MCYRNPGPRCSGYAEKLLADASQRLRDLQELINEGKEILHILFGEERFYQ